MKMNEENIDKIFRDRTENISKIPSSIKWNKDEGWDKYRREYSHTIVLNKKLLLAASITLLAIASTILFYIKLHEPFKLIAFESDENLVKEITFKNGHKCFLSPGSKIQYQEARIADTLFLDGEGYFETSARKPLVIIAKNTVTKCMHSKLDIKAVRNSKSTIINSLEGNVSSCCVDNNFPEMSIEPNERCIIYQGGIYAAKEPNTDRNFLSWKTGILSFNNVPLAHAVKKLEEFYNVKIEVQSDEVKYCRLSSDFENTTFESVLEYIQCRYDAIVNRSRNSITLEGGMCKN